jgi:AAA domain
MLSAIIGMTVRNQLESLSAFNRNDCPLSSESAGRDLPIKLMTAGAGGAVIAVPGVKDEIIAELKSNSIDVLVIDPFVKSHSVNENDNGQIDAVATEWANIAEAANCSIELLHHTRKNGGQEVTVEDARGAGSLVNAARSVRVANKMTTEEAAAAGIDKRQKWRYFRTDDPKANMSPPPDKALWYRLETQPLGNGDDVGVVTRWEWPEDTGVSAETITAAQQAIRDGGPWLASARSPRWVGIPAAEAVRLDLSDPHERKRVLTLVKTWIENRWLKTVTREDETRHERVFVEVGNRADGLDD